MRYSNTEIKNRKYETVIMPKIPQSSNDIIILTKYGDRLDLLAKQYYNNISL